MTRRKIASKIAPKLLDKSKRDQTIQQLAAYLVDEGRTAEVELLLGDIAQEIERLGHSDIHLVSARKLSVEVKAKLEQIIKKQTNVEDTKLYETIDESLIGGVIATTPSMEIDLSVRSKLKTLGSN